MRPELDTALLKDYQLFEKANSGSWNILSYLNFKYDIDAALGFSKFFLPDFIVHKNCLVLSFLFNEEIFDAWYSDTEGDRVKIEKMCNLYEVKDFFHINSDIEHKDFESKIFALSSILKYSWQMVLDDLYPNRYIVDTFFDYSHFITIYSRE